MSRPLAPILCDGPGCTNRKQESNRWWQIVMQDPAKNRGRFRLCMFDSEESQIDSDWAGWTWYDFCGQTCALKWVSEQMGKVTS